MVRLGVCLEPVFVDLPVEERIRRIRDAGYDAVEFWHPEGTWDGSTLRLDMPKDPGSVRAAASAAGIELSDFSLHAWDGSIGGSPVKAIDLDRYLAQVKRTIAFGKAAGCSKGITLSGTVDPALPRGEMRRNLEHALHEAVRIAEREEFTLLLEPLNTLVDHPGYYLESSREGFEIVRAMKSPRLRLLFDVYHMQVMEGNLLASIEKNLEWIGHFHAAGVPGRDELFGGEVNYPELIRRLDALGYEGAFGLEYFPKMPDHSESLRRTREYLLGED
jgi:hydroxypyruvate isomerase